jgi:hypothetical protein
MIVSKSLFHAHALASKTVAFVINQNPEGSLSMYTSLLLLLLLGSLLKD